MTKRIAELRKEIEEMEVYYHDKPELNAEYDFTSDVLYNELEKLEKKVKNEKIWQMFNSVGMQ